MRRRAAGWVAALAGLAVAITAAPAWAQGNYGTGGLTLSSGTATPGQSLQVNGSGFGPNSNVTITFTSDPVVLATTRAGADGTFSVTVTLPANATPGAHTITASGTAPDGSARILTTPVTVATTSGGGLVRTGGDSGGLLRWAAVLVAVGFVLVVSVSLRRRVMHNQPAR